MSGYKNWKAERRAAGERVNQEMVAARLGISQSAFSQYCRGAIPINVELLTALHAELSIAPHTTSPRLAKEMAVISDAAGTPFDRDHYRVRLIDAALSAESGKVAFSRDVRKHLAFRKDFLLRQMPHLDELGVFPVPGDSMDKLHIVDGTRFSSRSLSRKDGSGLRARIVLLAPIPISTSTRTPELSVAHSGSACAVKDI